MTTTYVIPQKLFAGSIRDIASSHYDRDIVFAAGCKCADYDDHLATFQDGRWVHNHIPGTQESIAT